MKIKDMEIFLDLLNTQNPTHTANNFSIIQPNVSIVIKNLENKVGTSSKKLNIFLESDRMTTIKELIL